MTQTDTVASRVAARVLRAMAYDRNAFEQQTQTRGKRDSGRGKPEKGNNGGRWRCARSIEE